MSIQPASRWTVVCLLLLSLPGCRTHVDGPFLDQESESQHKVHEPDARSAIDRDAARVEPTGGNTLANERPPTEPASPNMPKQEVTLEAFKLALGPRWENLSPADKRKTEQLWQQARESERDMVFGAYAAPEQALASLTAEKRREFFRHEAPTFEAIEELRSSCPWINPDDLSVSDRLFIFQLETQLEGLGAAVQIMSMQR